MTRSTFTNQLIKSMLDNGSNVLMIDDGGETHACHTFKKACEVIDSVSESQIIVSRKYDSFKYGWLHLIMDNERDEQLCDYACAKAAPQWIESRVSRLTEEEESRQSAAYTRRGNPSL